MSRNVSIIVVAVIASIVGLIIGRSGYNFGSCSCCPGCHSFGIYKPCDKPEPCPLPIPSPKPMPPIRPGSLELH